MLPGNMLPWCKRGFSLLASSRRLSIMVRMAHEAGSLIEVMGGTTAEPVTNVR